MEETCARLREEIELLKNENKTLENIYLANGISRISKNNDEDQLSKWVNETLENITSTEPYVEDSRTVYLLSKTLNWADSTFSTSLINHISNYPLRQKPPLLKPTQPFSTTTKIHSAFCHLVNNTPPFATTIKSHFREILACKSIPIDS